MYLSSLWAPSLPAAVCYDGDCWKRVERPPKRKCVELEMPYLPESSKPVLAVLEVVVLVKERLLN